MKFLTRFSLFNTLANARGVGVNNHLEGQGEQLGQIEALLSNPLSFSFASINQLADSVKEADGKLEPSQQAMFSKLINFHLARLQNEERSSVRSRTLFAIFRNPQLNQFLSVSQRRSIELFLTQERRELEKLGNEKAENWKPDSAIRMARSYRFVRSRLNTTELKVDDKLRDAGDQLKVYANTIASKNKEDLSAKEKLFLIEINRIFPESRDWHGFDNYDQIAQKASEVKTSFQAAVTAGTVPADAQAYWDVLVDEDSAQTSEPVSKFLERSATVESLQAIEAKNQSGDEKANQVPLVLSIEEFDFLQNVQKNSELSPKFGQASYDESVKNALTEKEKAEDAHNQLKEARNQSKKSLEQSDDDTLASHVKLAPELKTHYEQQKETWAQANAATQEGADAGEVGQAKTAYKSWRDKAIESILEDEEAAKELEKAEKEAKDKTAIWENATAEQKKANESLALYTDPSEKAAKLLEKHDEYFKARLESGRLLGADFELIAKLSKRPEGQTHLKKLLGDQTDAITDLLDETRDVLKAALSDEFQVEDLQQLSEAQLDSVDKFLSYEGVMQRLSANKLSGKSSQLLETFEVLDKKAVVDPRQLLGAVSLEFRDKIVKGLENSPVRHSDAYQRFVDHYARQHHAVHENGRVQNLLSFTSEIERSRGEINQEHEHAYEKISALFADSEAEALERGLGKILKTNINPGSVLNEIRSQLPEGEFIHSLTPTQITAQKGNIIGALKDKVTAENADEKHLEVIAEDLLVKLDELAAGEVAKKALQSGIVSLETTDEDDLSQTDRLELARRTKLVHLEALNLSESFQDEVRSIQAALERGESPDTLIQSFIYNYRQSYRPRLGVLQKTLIAEANMHFGKTIDFITTLDGAITKRFALLDGVVDQLESKFKSGDVKLGDEGFKALESTMNGDILPLFDLKNGLVAQKQDERIDGILKQAPATHAFVKDELGLLKPGGAEKAEEAFNKKLKEYEEQVEAYKTSWEATRKRLEKDLSRLSEVNFAAKHNIPKSHARKVIQGNSEKLNDAEFAIRYFNGQEPETKLLGGPTDQIFKHWLKAYEDPNNQPQALFFMKHFKEFGEVLKKEKFGEDIKELETWNKDYDSNKPTFLFGTKKYKLTWNWYSLMSVYMMGKQFLEYWQKRTDRANDRMAAALGADLFGDTAIGREFGIDANKKESERVSDFKESFGDKDTAYLMNRINQASDALKHKDEARAAIELLIEKGELRWDSPELLNLLGRLQDGVNFNAEEDRKLYVENPARVKQRIGQAVTAIWDRPTWLQWKGDLPSKYKSQVDSHASDYREEIQKGSVDTYLKRVLDQWRRGEVDPSFERTKFEAYLRNTFDNGEMNGYALGNDRRWYYLIMGLTLKNPQGDTILSPDTLSRFGEMQGKMPFMDAFDDGASAKKDGRVVPDGTPGSHKDWTYEDFQCWAKYFSHITDPTAQPKECAKAVRTWLNETLLTTNDAQDRMGKVNLTDIDRDDAGILPLLVSSERLRDGILRYASGDKRPADDKYYVNLLSSFDQNYEDSVEYMKRILSQEDKNAPGYKERKDTQLRRFGEIMRTYFMVSQVLAGNWDTDGSVGAVVLSDAEWNNNNGEESYETINKRVSEFLGGTSGAFIDGLQKVRYKTQKSKDAKDPEQKRVWQGIHDIYTDKNKLFQNADLIQRYIESQ